MRLETKPVIHRQVDGGGVNNPIRGLPAVGIEKGRQAFDGWSTANGGERLTACGESVAVVRKKALLRLLARREAERANLSPTDADVQAASERFRDSHGLSQDADWERWRTANGLSLDGYDVAMRDFALVRLVEDLLAREIDALAPDHIAISTARVRHAKSD
jgi:hypothetical protein